MICPIKQEGSWVGCLGWQRGRVRTFFLFNPFPLFQIKVEPLNSYFSIIQRKKELLGTSGKVCTHPQSARKKKNLDYLKIHNCNLQKEKIFKKNNLPEKTFKFRF